MNNRSVIALLVLAGAMGALGLVLMIPRGKSIDTSGMDGKAPGLVPTHAEANEANRGADIKRGGPPRRHRNRPIASSTNTPFEAAAPMPTETAADIEEMFAVTERLNDLLDSENQSEAMKEARRLATHPNREVRLAALQAMQWIGPAAAADMLIFFENSDAETRQEAEDAFWSALDEFDDPKAKLEALKALLKSSTPSMRLQSLDELIFMPDILSFGVIAGMLNDPDEAVQAAAREKLEFISEESFETEKEAMTWFGQNKAELEFLSQ